MRDPIEILFAGTETTESDELRQIARTAKACAGNLVKPYFIISEGAQRSTDDYSASEASRRAQNRS